jgi:type II secretory pathway component PulF
MKLNKIMEKMQLMGFHGKRTEFYEDLAKSYERKELLSNFIEAELEISRNKDTRDDSRAFALKCMLNQIRNGDEVGLVKTVGRYMPASDSMLLAAVDSAKEADKSATLRALANALREQAENKSVIVKSVMVPVIITPVVFGFAYILSSQSIPIIEKIAPKEVWTPFNSAVRTFANFTADYGLLCLLSLLAFAIFFTLSLPKWRSQIRYKLEKINPSKAIWLTPIAPWLLPLSIYRDIQAGMVMTAMAVLLRTGKSLTLALDAVYNNSSPYMKRHIRAILNHLQDSPTQYAQAFSKGLLSPRLMARMSSLIRNTPEFDKVIMEVGTTGNAEIRAQVEKTAKKLNFMFLAGAGLTVIFLYLGQLNISNTMKDEMDPVRMKQRMAQKMERQKAGLNH